MRYARTYVRYVRTGVTHVRTTARAHCARPPFGSRGPAPPSLLLRVALGGAGVGRAGAPPLLLRVEGSVGEAQRTAILRYHSRKMEHFKMRLAQRTILRYHLRKINDFQIPFAQNEPCVVKKRYTYVHKSSAFGLNFAAAPLERAQTSKSRGKFWRSGKSRSAKNIPGRVRSTAAQGGWDKCARARFTRAPI